MNKNTIKVADNVNEILIHPLDEYVPNKRQERIELIIDLVETLLTQNKQEDK